MTRPKEVTLQLSTRRTDLAYLAGIVDGEGCISRLNRRRPRRWSVSIASTSPELILWLAEFGGNVHEMKPGHLGKKQGWMWSVASWRDVRCLLVAIQPYMRIKRDVALHAIEEINEWLAEAGSLTRMEVESVD
jgi:intein/homing endonuclease